LPDEDWGYGRVRGISGGGVLEEVNVAQEIRKGEETKPVQFKFSFVLSGIKGRDYLRKSGCKCYDDEEFL
jgi:hypothetical protein